MKIIKQGHTILTQWSSNDPLKEIEIAGRTCYKSELRMGPSSEIDFVKKMIKSGHHAMLEFFVPPSVRLVTDRGVSHEIVRHRLFSFAQESTRYCNYSCKRFGSEITFILPVWFYGDNVSESYREWEKACKASEDAYLRLIEMGQSPQEARSVLNNSLKTEIVVKGNAREWRHFFTLRISKRAHPQMAHLARGLLDSFKSLYPVIFDDIGGDM